MNKNWFFLVLFLAMGCSKEETLTRTEHFRDLVYTIETNETDLQVEFMRGQYDSLRKGNIAADTAFPAAGTYQIPATVLRGDAVVLFAQSNNGPEFHLKISDKDGTVLGETDSITFYPANQLQEKDLWISKVKITP